ncbi:hypothetical protein LQ327_04785 [Actinomycetospora endophytica]|uniref:Excreted virulence factor EspC (Type VII ESX diderm) n=1 Tax=Actinomycetospora endophytica TaxID=2291215 RepID=A0ABS8P375_9PSEU|nr:hypothetical protein [Actinomycetospora endophytica]MCD2192704.1 hypothetical protein [Actinomycetospora endophytica]
MSSDETSPSPVHGAVDALLQLNQHGQDLCPADADPQDWAAGVLYDLARVAELLDGAVERVSGKRNDTVAQNSQALASVIAAHRNIEVGAAAE